MRIMNSAVAATGARWALTTVGVLSLLGLASCRNTGLAPTGSYSEILVVTGTGRPDPTSVKITNVLKETLVYVIKEEPRFKVLMTSAEELEAFPPYKNILLLGPMLPNTALGQKIMELLGPSGVQRVRSGQGYLFVKNNMPSPSQLTAILTAPTTAEYQQVVERTAPNINAVIERSIRERLRVHLLEKEQMELTNWYRDKYGFTLRLPVSYEMLTDRPKFKAIEFLHRQPTRLLAVFWRPWSHNPTMADTTALYSMRAEYAEEMYEGDYMVEGRTSFRTDQFGPYASLVLEGAWANRGEVIGGPFRCDFVFDEKNGLVWGVDQVVYAPDFPKHPLLRELLAVAETFRYPGGSHEQ